FSSNNTSTTAISPLSLHDALPISQRALRRRGARKQRIQVQVDAGHRPVGLLGEGLADVERPFVLVAVHEHDGQDELVRLVEAIRSEEHTSELQSRENLVCRLLLEK